MSLLGILGLVLQIAQSLASYLHDRQLMDAGAAKATLKGLQDAQAATLRARAARDAVRDDADSVRNDPDNRDAK